jgi:hypothetical protein
MRRDAFMASNDPGTVREYPCPAPTVINAINDLVELQKGEITFDDILRGKIFFKVEMYGFLWEYRFTVTSSGAGQSRVELEVEGEIANKAIRIAREFALLESMLNGNIKNSRAKDPQTSNLQASIQ